MFISLPERTCLIPVYKHPKALTIPGFRVFSVFEYAGSFM